MSETVKPNRSPVSVRWGIGVFIESIRELRSKFYYYINRLLIELERRYDLMETKFLITTGDKLDIINQMMKNIEFKRNCEK